MARDAITMSSLGKSGRFANQIVQYMFLKTYGWRHDLEVQTPPWVGQQLFGVDDPPIRSPLPEFVELYDKDPERMVIPMLSRPLRNVDFSGFFQYQSSYYAPFRDEIRSLFTPVSGIKRELDRATIEMRKLGKTLVGMHLRRRDYGYEYFYITPSSWYVSWLESVWDTLDDPVLFVASDDLKLVLPDFRDYQPVSVEDLGVSLPQAPYYPDFYLLSQVDYLAIPNSTFSFIAAMLNRNLRAAYRSHLQHTLEDPPFRAFDPWDAPMLDCHAHVESFPHIQGLTRRRKGHGKYFSRRRLRSMFQRRKA